MSGSIEHLDTAGPSTRHRGRPDSDWTWLGVDRLHALLPRPSNPALISSLLWTLALAAAAVTTPLWRSLGWLLVSPWGPSTAPATAVAIALVGLVVILALGIVTFARRGVGALAAVTAALAVPALMWWGLQWRGSIPYAPLGLTALTALAAPLLILGLVLVVHAALSIVLAPAILRRGSPLPTPIELFVVCAGASLALCGAVWLALVVIAGLTIRATMLRRWRIAVLSGVSGVAVFVEQFGLLSQLVSAVGDPPWWIGIPIAIGLLWWGILGLRGHTMLVTLVVQFGLLGVLVSSATIGDPDVDLWRHVPLAYGIGFALVFSTAAGLIRPRRVQPAGAEPDPYGRRWPGICVGVGFLMMALVAILLVPPVSPTRLEVVPTDGAGRPSAWVFNAEGGLAQVENRWLHDYRPSLWWEERITVTDVPVVVDAEDGQPIVDGRTRLLHAADGGVELRRLEGVLDGDLELGPGAVLLPDDHRVDDSWTGAGTGTLTKSGRQIAVSFEISGFVIRQTPPESRGVDLDCTGVTTELTVRSAVGDTVVTDESWWCPGEGPVLQAGEVGGKRFHLVPFSGRDVWTGMDEPRIPRLPRPDELAGGCPDGIVVPGIPLQVPLVVDVRPGQDRFRLSPVDGCDPVAPEFEQQPGGRLLHATSLGTLYVVTSTTGAVTAHVLPRERLWRTVLPAPTRTAPVRVGRSLAVLDTRDRVTFLDLDTGEIRGELHVPGARTLTGAADTNGATARVAITDRTGRVTLADENAEVTASIRTGMDLDHHQPLALHRQGIVAWNGHRIEVRGDDGSVAWQARRPVTGAAMVDGDMGPVLVVLGPDATDGLDPATGELRWSGPAAHAVAPVGDGVVMLTADGLQFVNSRGQVLGTLAAPAITGRGQLTVFDGHIWLRWIDPVRGPLLSHWVVG